MKAIYLAMDQAGKDVRFVDLRMGQRQFLDYQALARLVRTGNLQYSLRSLVAFLRFGFFPPPLTAYAGVFRLSSGDELDTNLHYKNSFSFYEHLSRGDSNPQEFKDVFYSTVEKHVPRTRPVVVLLSGGQDSTAILFALYDLGYSNVRTRTYTAGYGTDEGPYARALTASLGYGSEILRPNPQVQVKALNRAIDMGLPPVGDGAFVPYLELLSGLPGGSIVLDGEGNSIFAGYLPSARETTMSRTSLMRYGLDQVYGQALPFGPSSRVSYALQSLTMNPHERLLAGSRVDISEMGTKYSRSISTLWNYLMGQYVGSSEVDRKTYLRGRLHRTANSMEKGGVASAALGIDVRFPYSDSDLADYWFNLPPSEKYSYAKRTGKLPLTNYLENRFAGLNVPQLRGKGSFRFNYFEYLNEMDEKHLAALPVLDDYIPASRLYKQYRRWPNNYVSTQKAYLLGILAYWISRSGVTVIDDLDSSEYLKWK